VSVQHYWDVQVNSIGGSDAPFTWMAFEKPATSGIIIDSVNILSGNTIGSSLAVAGTYNGNIWYQNNPSTIVVAHQMHKITVCISVTLIAIQIVYN